MTVTISKAIRAALAAAGYGKADVSVYNKGYSMGSTVYVTIKRAEISLANVEALANAHERVDRDSTGEILGGGNCFVDVRYAPEALASHAAIINEQVAAGRVRFGSHELHEKDRFTWQVWTSNGDGTARASMHLDRKLPGDGFARILASSGELSVLHDMPANDARAADAAPEYPPMAEPCPVCGSTEDHTGLVCIARPAAPARFIHPAPLGIDEMHAATSSPEALIARGNAIAAEMFGAEHRTALERARAADPLSPLPGFSASPEAHARAEAATLERLERRVLRAAERWQAAFPCPPESEPRLRALWLAVDRLIEHDSD